MRFKVLVVDLELTRTQRARLVRASVGLAVASVAVVAHAAVPHAWSDGDTLRANDLNRNFAVLDDRIAAIEATVPLAGDVAALVDQVAAMQGQLAAQATRLDALESLPAPLTEASFHTAQPTDAYYAECLAGTGIFPQGACARMAYYRCTADGYLSGWFEGDISADNIGITCVK